MNDAESAAWNRRSASGFLLITDRLRRRSAWRAKGADIPHGWLAKETAVYAASAAFEVGYESELASSFELNEFVMPREE